jgi:2-polyprenyl-6-hydroxyphenyl methylase/3-demethylubiquinone-9 3-methyltransferase
MKKAAFDSSWSSEVQSLFEYDLLENFGKEDKSKLDYKVPYWNRRDLVLNELKSRSCSVKSILDIGAAQGNFTFPLAEAGFDVTWNDIRIEILDYTKSKFEFGKVDYIVGNIFELEIEKKFDCILITEVIEHVAHPDKFLERCKELLSPNGIIVMTTPNGKYFRNKLPKFSDHQDPTQFEAQQFKPDSDGHIFLLHPEEVFLLARSVGMSIETYIVFNNFFTSGHLKLRYILKYVPLSVVSAIETMTRKFPQVISRRLHVQSLAILVNL